MSSKERLMAVLVAPHVSEKSARVAEQGNQFVFRVARDATKPEIKAAVELMFEVKVDARERRERRRQGEALRRPSRASARTSRRRTCASRRARRSTSPASRSDDGVQQTEGLNMALIKTKPTSPGRRFVVKPTRSHLHKGEPVHALTSSQEARPAPATTSAASPRATWAAVTSSTTASSTSSATRTASRARSSASSTIRTAPRTSRSCCYADGERRYIIAPKGLQCRRRGDRRASKPRSRPATRCRCATSRSARRALHRDEARQGRRSSPAAPAPRRSWLRAKASTRRCACAPARCARCTSTAAPPSAKSATTSTTCAATARPARSAGAASARRSAASS